MYADAIEERVPPLAALAVAVAAISTSAILVRWSDAPNLVKAFYRVAFTVALVLPFAGGYRDDFRALSHRDLASALLAGVALAAHFAAWFESLDWTTVAASVTLVQTQPLFVAVGAAAVLDEQLTPRMAGGIVVAVAGAAVMSLGGGLAGDAPLYGNALAVAGAVMAAGYVLAGRAVRQRVALVPYVLVVYSACAVVLAVLAAANGHTLTGYPTSEWLLFLAMAVGPGLLGHTVINWSLEYVESSVVSVTLLGEPVGSTLLAVAAFHEIPGLGTLAGGAVVLAGIYVTASARRA